MLALGWPLILTNVAQNALMTSDVILMGRLGPQVLAAGALGTNLYFAFLIFGIGLVSATSPLIAEELGRRRHAVTRSPPHRAAGPLGGRHGGGPDLARDWNGERILLAIGQQPDLARMAGDYIRALQWSLLPFLFYLVLRSFLAALERPGWALVIGLLALPVNVGAAWGLMFGKFGFPAMGLVGAGIAHGAVQHLHVRWPRRRDRPRPEAEALPCLRPLLAPRLAALPRSLAHRRADRSDARVRGDDLQRRRSLMGRIGADELAAHAIALQIASFCFMVPFGIGQAVTVRVGRAFGARDAEGVTRAGWTAFALGIGFMVFTALSCCFAPHLLIGAFLDLGDPKNAAVVGFAVSFLVLAALFQLADGSPGRRSRACCGACRTPACR